MNSRNRFRKNGAIGALLDEYERALTDLKEVIHDISNKELIEIVDNITKDKDCESVQSILSHVVQSGYTYVIEIRKWLGENKAYKENVKLLTITEYRNALNDMFLYNEKLFEDYPTIKLELHDPSKKINVRWGQKYDVEQLYEHAIVHILRHRRQIERFKIKLRSQK